MAKAFDIDACMKVVSTPSRGRGLILFNEALDGSANDRIANEAVAAACCLASRSV
jgi:hypothetical protein